MTININLTPHLEDIIRKKVDSGLYASASEVVREALRLMEEQDRVKAIKLEQLRRDIGEGLESGEPTQWNPEEVKRQGRERKRAQSRGKEA